MKPTIEQLEALASPSAFPLFRLSASFLRLPQSACPPPRPAVPPFCLPPVFPRPPADCMHPLSCFLFVPHPVCPPPPPLRERVSPQHVFNSCRSSQLSTKLSAARTGQTSQRPARGRRCSTIKRRLQLTFRPGLWRLWRLWRLWGCGG
jgi:hypothetical protein